MQALATKHVHPPEPAPVPRPLAAPIKKVDEGEDEEEAAAEEGASEGEEKEEKIAIEGDEVEVEGECGALLGRASSMAACIACSAAQGSALEPSPPALSRPPPLPYPHPHPADEEEEDKPKTRKVTETVTDWALLNDNQALWLRPPGDITDAEYQKFYKALSKARVVVGSWGGGGGPSGGGWAGFGRAAGGIGV